MEPVLLNTDATMPPIGFGTWQLDTDTAYSAVHAALQSGYRLIDTARVYNNEVGVGYALRNSGIPRDELFVTTKLWNDDQGYDEALRAFDASLARLGLDYVDLYLIHWPSSLRRLDSWRALETIYRSGRAKAIGVSNYTVTHLRELLQHTDITPAVNQIEIHPLIYEEQLPIIDFCRQQGIVVEAYSPLIKGSAMKHPVVTEVAERCGRSNAQVLIRWSIQHGFIPLPRSKNPEHIAQNIAVSGFRLRDADMRLLDQISDGTRVTPNPYDID